MKEKEKKQFFQCIVEFNHRTIVNKYPCPKYCIILNRNIVFS